MAIDWASFIIGLTIGFILGFLAVFLFNCRPFKGDHFLAWVISLSWVIWHISAGLGIIGAPPPTMYDVVSGGSVGFILGEKFWDGVKFWKK